MTYAEKLAFETANEIFELDLICKRIDEFESRSVESTIQAVISKAMQAQREACAAIAWESVAFMHQSDYDNVEDYAREVKQAILNAEVQP